MRHSTTTFFFFLMIRRPPRSTLDRSSAASDVYKRQAGTLSALTGLQIQYTIKVDFNGFVKIVDALGGVPVSYTHLRAHETVLDLVCRLLLEKKNTEHNETPLNDSTS